jgi:hypothetical protein
MKEVKPKVPNPYHHAV